MTFKNFVFFTIQSPMIKEVEQKNKTKILLWTHAVLFFLHMRSIFHLHSTNRKITYVGIHSDIQTTSAGICEEVLCVTSCLPLTTKKFMNLLQWLHILISKQKTRLPKERTLEIHNMMLVRRLQEFQLFWNFSVENINAFHFTMFYTNLTQTPPKVTKGYVCSPFSLSYFSYISWLPVHNVQHKRSTMQTSFGYGIWSHSWFSNKRQYSSWYGQCGTSTCQVSFFSNFFSAWKKTLGNTKCICIA